jgi:hypothetical protein
MGFIKEPDGVDFIIKSDPLTEAEKKIISEFILKDKAKHKAHLSTNKKHRSAKNKQFV